mmetsp:Transcript_9632/g.9359  ORF Transcript_9632/g.9359 Transcript_9632/m.9359 type:complete len:110 (+) Transcript_9632:91-420(+)
MARWWIQRETQTIICIVCLYVPTVLNDSMIQEDYVGMNEWAVLCCDNSSARERKRRRSNSSASYLFSNHVRSISNSFFIIYRNRGRRSTTTAAVATRVWPIRIERIRSA